MRVVGHIGGGEVVRPDNARTARDLRWRTRDGEAAVDALQPLVCGPSFLALLEVFPRGQLPPETACAIVDALVPPPDGVASLARLRFDLDDKVFRWSARPLRGVDRAFAPWRQAVIARLLGRHGPRFEIVFARKDPSGPPPDLDDLPWQHIDEGRRHLAGIVAAALPERLAQAHAQREQWLMHDGPPPEPQVGSTVERRHKAELIFMQAEYDCLSGLVSAAQMNVQLATLYDPQCKRYERAMQALTL
jgi:hypothetical protein